MGKRHLRNAWQLLPDLTVAEFAALKRDIAMNGVRVPVVVDAETGAVIDGHHRVRAWKELREESIAVPDYPREVRRFRDDDERLGFVLAANLFRRHLSRAARAALVTDLRARGWSLRRLSAALGVHHETVRRDLAGVASATPGARVTGRDAKMYPALRQRAASALVVRSARSETRARAVLTALGDATPGPDLRRAEEKARIAALERRRAEAVPRKTTGKGYELRLGDFREALSDLKDHSIDAIICDPPYNKEGLATYEMLSEFAARVLIPGRLCVVYCGKAWLPDHFRRLSEHLEYVWTGCVWMPGRHTIFRKRMVFGRWRPVAFFSAGRYEIRSTIVDGLSSPGRGEKGPEDHPWQQGIVPFTRLVEMTTRPNELVVDPFVGSGTTAIACLATNRRFLGADIDPGAVALARERIDAYRRGELVIERDAESVSKEEEADAS